MSTPPNKRDQRRQDRLTNLAQSQASRRAEAEQEQPVVTDDTEGVTTAQTTSGAVGATPAKASVTGKTTTRPVGTTAGVSKTPTRPTTSARARATGVAPGAAAKPSTRPVGAVAGKATTRPTGASGAVKASAAGGVVDDTEAGFVTKRDQRRETRRADLARIQEERRRARLAQRRKEQRNRWLIIGITAVIVLLFGFWVVKMVTAPGTPSGSTAAAVTGVPEAGGYGAQILCQSGEQFTQHIHANVQIVINGKKEPIPAGVGIQTNSTGVQCYNWLHTHDTTGVVHIESPNASGQYLLGDFLAVWQKFSDRWIPEGKPQITATSFFGMPIDKTHPVTVYVNKKKFTGDPNNLVLYSGENIWLEYGTQQVTPTNFDFAANGVSP